MFNNPLPKLPSQDSYSFAKTPNVELPRSTFDRSHRHLTTIDSGYLYPIIVDDVIPGDTHKMRSTHLGRMTTPIYPLMDDLYLDIFYFYVPYRILQDNFVKIHGEQDNPADSIDYLTPKVDLSSGVSELSLYDFLGYPTGSVYGSDLTEMPNNYAARAYNLIWNEYFRDQNLQDSVPVDKDDGVDTASDYVLLRRGKRHDYFTSCLPSPQKGDSVSLPLGTTAPIATGATGTYLTIQDETGVDRGLRDAGAGLFRQSSTPSSSMPMFADLATATSATINELRLAFQTQRILEKDARGGTRYIEHLKSHYGVTSPDFRLQRPEYLGSGHSRVDIQQVPQTSSTDTTSPQGNLSAYGTVVAHANFTQSFDEHGIIIGLANVRANLTYQQGLERQFWYDSRYDFYYPSLAHIGEQAVLNREIFTQGTTADRDVFGYQEAWAHLRYKPDRVSAKMRSNSTGPLDAWHLAQDFSTLPVLNSSFIEDNPPLDRVLAVGGEPQFLLDNYFNYKSTRVMPTYSVPGMIDHF